jgi:hypothetical protein
MANNAPTTTQLQYLRQASYALAATAPEISAHLMSRYLSLSPPDFNLDADRSTACFACGTIRTPGCILPARTAAVREPEKKRKRQMGGEKGGEFDSSSIEYVCAACQKITVSTEPRTTGTNSSPKKSSSTATESKAVTLAVAPAATKSPSDSTKPSSSQSSRKRSKKGTSLSKMLAAQKPGASGGGPSGLNLMDLLKTA